MLKKIIDYLSVKKRTYLYKYITSKNYHFVNWLHGDLIFVSNDFRD